MTEKQMSAKKMPSNTAIDVYADMVLNQMRRSTKVNKLMVGKKGVPTKKSIKAMIKTNSGLLDTLIDTARAAGLDPYRRTKNMVDVLVENAGGGLNLANWLTKSGYIEGLDISKPSMSKSKKTPKANVDSDGRPKKKRKIARTNTDSPGLSPAEEIKSWINQMFTSPSAVFIVGPKTVTDDERLALKSLTNKIIDSVPFTKYEGIVDPKRMADILERINYKLSNFNYPEVKAIYNREFEGKMRTYIGGLNRQAEAKVKARRSASTSTTTTSKPSTTTTTSKPSTTPAVSEEVDAPGVATPAAAPAPPEGPTPALTPPAPTPPPSRLPAQDLDAPYSLAEADEFKFTNAPSPILENWDLYSPIVFGIVRKLGLPKKDTNLYIQVLERSHRSGKTLKATLDEIRTESFSIEDPGGRTQEENINVAKYMLLNMSYWVAKYIQDNPAEFGTTNLIDELAKSNEDWKQLKSGMTETDAKITEFEEAKSELKEKTTDSKLTEAYGYLKQKLTEAFNMVYSSIEKVFDSIIPRSFSEFIATLKTIGSVGVKLASLFAAMQVAAASGGFMLAAYSGSFIAYSAGMMSVSAAALATAASTIIPSAATAMKIATAAAAVYSYMSVGTETEALKIGKTVGGGRAGVGSQQLYLGGTGLGERKIAENDDLWKRLPASGREYKLTEEQVSNVTAKGNFIIPSSSVFDPGNMQSQYDISAGNSFMMPHSMDGKSLEKLPLLTQQYNLSNFLLEQSGIQEYNNQWDSVWGNSMFPAVDIEGMVNKSRLPTMNWDEPDTGRYMPQPDFDINVLYSKMTPVRATDAVDQSIKDSILYGLVP